MARRKSLNLDLFDDSARSVSPVGDMKRLRARAAFTSLFNAVSRKAARAGVQDYRRPDGEFVSKHARFEELHAANFKAFYGGVFEPKDIEAARGLAPNASWLDFAGTTELNWNNERLRVLGRAMDELKGNKDFDAALEASRNSAADLRAQFRRYSGLRPENFETVEPIKDVEKRWKGRAASNENAEKKPASGRKAKLA